jgi:uncharacterized membrane protein
MGPLVALAGASVLGLPFVAWAAAHYRPDVFGLAALWILGAMLPLLAWPPRGQENGTFFPAAALVAGAAVSVVLAYQTDRPLALLVLLGAQAVLAALARPRWPAAEAAGVVGTAVAVFAWFDRFFTAARAAEGWRLAAPLALFYLLVLAGRTLLGRTRLGVGGLFAHLGNAAFFWTIAWWILYDAQQRPHRLAALTALLAALYLGLAFLARETRPEDGAQVNTFLGLAVVFLTLAIPLRLGLYAITLAWAAEGVLLLWLGVRSRSGLLRLAGYTVLALAVLRLLVRHLPLHPESFTVLVNEPFGTWLFVIGALALAAAVTRRADDAFDRLAAKGFVTLALVMLFGLLTGETDSAFSWRARALEASGDWPGAQAAQRQSGLAVSVLWTLYATALLAGGLFARNRPLFYSSYALFLFTAAKVVAVDLSVFPTLYRMLSFLVLGVLLLAGAWLNLRFRERLLPKTAPAEPVPSPSPPS